MFAVPRTGWYANESGLGVTLHQRSDGANGRRRRRGRGDVIGYSIKTLHFPFIQRSEQRWTTFLERKKALKMHRAGVLHLASLRAT